MKYFDIKKNIRNSINKNFLIPRLKFPTELEFEPVQLCNALCFTCPYTTLQKDDSYRGKAMSREKIALLLTDFGNLLKKNNYKGRSVVNPFRYSDPLVGKDLDLVFALSKKLNFKVRITTNGVSFNSKYSELLSRYINQLSDPISISVIGSTREKIKEFMNVNFDITISRLAYVKNKYPELASKIIVNLSEVESTEKENNEIIYLQKEFKRIGIQTKIRKKWINNRIIGDWKTTAELSNQVSSDNFIKSCNLYKNKLLRRIEVMVDGSVVLCDDDAEGKKSFGNVFLEGIEKIWNGKLFEYHKTIYEKKYSSQKENLICNTCSRANYNSRNDGVVDTFKETGKISLISKIIKNEVNWL
jgi:hypothetical protein